ncbi:arylsulfatase, putative [Candida dubliniensis CD36]|uniref:Arylsulfatase, putative n=1 Tax=Candida dubliniensis (strain CD36 / ATCC MYA-646 / CBS 7987 / NCPF 3949 / NRRL Y-17841) TaxID=573826 RepID=B9WDK4_CANDC|nr:arylsulfatase, putative [Candida dubliniensis CD36]CAX42760.1 arylsulfatase, putative [Candida dubliniensis CD36]
MTITSSPKQPNFLIIVADDLGFTDLSPFGGEIHTPNLNKLATGPNGIRLTDFHTASACSPTRSMLLSGTDNHIAGLGQMAEFAQRHPEKFNNQPGYEGYLNDKVVALPEILQDNGYHTFISGKWHLGLKKPYWPNKRGFNKSFTLLPGAGNHYKYITRDEKGDQIPFLPAIYVEDDKELLNPEIELPDDFYSTNYFTDKAIEFIKQSPIENKPFFGMITYTAPHWPYQAPQDKISKYDGIYNNGPEELRRSRLKSAIKLGLIDEKIIPHPIKTIRKTWDELTLLEKSKEIKIMQTYAAMVEILDENIGRLINYLKSINQFNNTFILFMSDNGAEGMLMESLPLTNQRINKFINQYYDNSLSNIGNKNSFTYYGDQWAQAATAPHAMYKMWSTEGAIVCPLIIHYPNLTSSNSTSGNSGGGSGNGNGGGRILKEFTTVMDILPTILQLANIQHPGEIYKNRKVVKPRGKSWVNYLINKTNQVHDENTVTGWELFGQQAIRKGSFKAIFIPKPFGPEKWQLFNIIDDPGEINDLSDLSQYKKILNELLDHWAIYAAETGLIELGSDLFEKEKIDGELNEIVYRTILDNN